MVDHLRDRRVRCYDDGGTEIAEIPEKDCFVFEATVKGVKYVLAAGEWFEVSIAFDKQINDYLKGITKTPVVLPKSKSIWKEEQDYVDEAAKGADLMSLHKKNFVISRTPVEPSDQRIEVD